MNHVVVGEGSALKNTIVYLMDISQGKGFDKAVKLEIDQKNCKFSPHVQIVPVGTRVTMLNNDKVNHNVHIFSSINKPVNKQQTKNRRKMPLAAVKKAGRSRIHEMRHSRLDVRLDCLCTASLFRRDERKR